MLGLSGIELSFADRTILRSVSLTLSKTTRAALVGANGSGKSTLLRILAGQLSADAGQRTVARDFMVSYLPQRVDIDPATTVFNHAQRAFERFERLYAERQNAAEQLSACTDHHSAEAHRLVQFVASIDDTLQHADYYTRHVAIGTVLSGLGFDTEAQRRAVGTFSGGWQMRIELARVLLEHPDLLLLDEPTNYLDTEARWWLARYLNDYQGGVCIVSHDRAFLDAVVQEVYEIFLAQVKRYRGNYSEYERVREEEIERLVASYHQQQREIERQEDFIRRFRAKATKARQVQSRVKQLEKIERIEIPEHLQPIKISIPAAPPSGDEVIVAEDVCKSYADNVVLEKLTFTVRRGERWAVIGHNGAGKSTLLRLLSSTERPNSGVLRLGGAVKAAYYAQDSADSLSGSETVLEYIERHAPFDKLPQVRDMLGTFLFRGDDVFKPLAVLSGGERSRLVLSTLLLRPVNLLILDEPTNHLDMTSQAVLLAALSAFSGTVLFVSHDRYFVDRLATTVLDLAAPQLGTNTARWRVYPGSYPDYRELVERLALGIPTAGRGTSLSSAGSPVQANNAGSTTSGARTSTTTSAADTFAQQKQRRAELQRLQRREADLLAQIESAEGRHHAAQAALADPSVYSDGERVKEATALLEAAEAALVELHAAWEEVAMQLETETPGV